MTASEKRKRDCKTALFFLFCSKIFKISLTNKRKNDTINIYNFVCSNVRMKRRGSSLGVKFVLNEKGKIMKKRVIKVLAMALCLVFCLQVLLGTGMFALRVDAASMGVPGAVSGTELSSTNAFPHGNNLTYFTKVDSTEASNYATQMVANGYTQTKTGTLGNMTYWHYKHTSGGVAYLVYQKNTVDSAGGYTDFYISGKKGELYVVTDDRSVTSAYTPKASYTKVTETTLGVMSLDYSYRTLADGHGMGYIWTLEDGSYLIMDGGYKHDSQRIYNYLVDNNKRTDGKIIIHAWYISHSHDDHYGAFQQFSADHAKDVTLEYVIASAAIDGDPLNNNLLNNMAKYSNAKLIRPHTGETYQMPGLQMDILYTCEDLYVTGAELTTGNNESILSRVTVGGQTVLFPGDSGACSKQIAMYGSALKSDFLQMNHHGISGASQDYFDHVKPSYVLWTASQFATDLRANGVKYQIGAGDTLNTANKNLLNNYLGGDMDRIFAGDGAVELITFPYDGNRDALPIYRMHDTKINYELEPELLITELAPSGIGNGWTEYIEVYNNTDGRLNIYDYCVLKDSNIFSANNIGANCIWYIKPGTTEWVAVDVPENRVTHTNPSYEEGWLEAGEVALLWVPTNTLWNSTGHENDTYTYKLSDFRTALGLTADQKAFVAYTNYAVSLNNGGSMMYAIGKTYKNYVGMSDTAYHNFVSYVYNNFNAEGVTPDGITVPTITIYQNGSIRYQYADNNRAKCGTLYKSESAKWNPGVLDSVQIRKPEIEVTLNGTETVALTNTTLDVTPYMNNPSADLLVVMTDANGKVTRSTQKTITVSDGMTVDLFENGKMSVYSQNFSGISAESHTFTDVGPASPNTTTTHYWQDLLKWDQMTPTDSVELEVTSDGRLRIYNPYYMTLDRSDVGAGVTPNPEFVVEIGDFSQLVGRKVVLEYDFQYNASKGYSTNGKTADAGAAAVFSFGQAVDRTRYCFAPALTVDGKYQARIGTSSDASLLYSQTVYSTGTRHVKIEIDPYNGITTYVDGIAVSAVQNPANWENDYAKIMGEIFGLTVAPGVEVYLDNINLYAEPMEAPNLIITEVGNAMGVYEYIEVYNNSDGDLDIYDFVLMRNTGLAATSSNAKWAARDIATIKKGTHTYTTASGQSVTLTNPASGIIKSGETVILWIPSNTTWEDNTEPTVETLEMFMNNYGLTEDDKIYAAYNNYNFSLYDGGNLGYAIGYANVDYTTHYTHAFNELVSYVYLNTSVTNVYGSTETVTKQASSLASVEYQYNHNNSVKRGTFLKSVASTHSCGTALDEQERIVEITFNGKTYEVPLSVNLAKLDQIALDTLTGASLRLNEPNGMRWVTLVDASDYAMLKKWLNKGVLTNVEIGTIIGRTEDLGSKALTLSLVDGTKFHKVVADDRAWFGETAEGDHLFAGSVANIKKENYTKQYSAVGYLSVTMEDGSTYTIYGGYNAADHARSVAEVAYKALNDANNGLSAAELEVVVSYAVFYEG